MEQNNQIQKLPRLTIVFLHGWGGSVSSWQNNVAYFTQKGFLCFTIKMPGFDLSEPKEVWGVSEYAEYVVGKIKETIGEIPCVLVGHSFGGRIALYISAHHPEMVGDLILTDSAGLSEKSFKKTLSNILSKMFGKLKIIFLRDIVVKLIGSKDYQKASPKMREILKKIVDLDLSFCLPKIICSTLIIWGRKDKVTPLNMAKVFNERIKNSQLKIIDGGGHHIHKTHSDIWNDIVYRFVKN